MKQLKYILLAAVALLWACGTKDNGADTSVPLGVNPTELVFTNDDASTKFVSVTTSATWSATADQTWVHLQNASGSGNGSFSVSVDAFDGNASRNAVSL